MYIPHSLLFLIQFACIGSLYIIQNGRYAGKGPKNLVISYKCLLSC